MWVQRKSPQEKSHLYSEYQRRYRTYLRRVRSLTMSAMNARERSPHSQAIADQIKAERARRGLTQREVYDAIDMARMTYIRIENGARVADVTQLAKIASVFEMPLALLIQRAEAEIERTGGGSATD